MRIAANEERFWPGLPASVHEGHVEDPAADFVKLGIEPQRISSIIATIRRAEQSLAGSSPLSSSEAKELVEILDRVPVSPKVPHRALNPPTIRPYLPRTLVRTRRRDFPGSFAGSVTPTMFCLHHTGHSVWYRLRYTRWVDLRIFTRGNMRGNQSA